jgi:hypothetical protein
MKVPMTQRSKNLIAALVGVGMAVGAAAAAGLASAQPGSASGPVGRYQMSGDGWRLDTASGEVWRCDVKNGRCVKYQVE